MKRLLNSAVMLIGMFCVKCESNFVRIRLGADKRRIMYKFKRRWSKPFGLEELKERKLAVGMLNKKLDANRELYYALKLGLFITTNKIGM